MIPVIKLQRPPTNPLRVPTNAGPAIAIALLCANTQGVSVEQGSFRGSSHDAYRGAHPPTRARFYKHSSAESSTMLLRSVVHLVAVLALAFAARPCDADARSSENLARELNTARRTIERLEAENKVLRSCASSACIDRVAEVDARLTSDSSKPARRQTQVAGERPAAAKVRLFFMRLRFDLAMQPFQGFAAPPRGNKLCNLRCRC
jgi:hypothetical protein